MDVAVNLPFINCLLSCGPSGALLFYSIINALAESALEVDAAGCRVGSHYDP